MDKGNHFKAFFFSCVCSSFMMGCAAPIPFSSHSLEVQTHVGKTQVQKGTIEASENQGNLTISTMPWWLSLLMILGWPIAVITWMLEPPRHFKSDEEDTPL